MVSVLNYFYTYFSQIKFYDNLYRYSLLYLIISLYYEIKVE